MRLTLSGSCENFLVELETVSQDERSVGGVVDHCEKEWLGGLKDKGASGRGRPTEEHAKSDLEVVGESSRLKVERDELADETRLIFQRQEGGGAGGRKGVREERRGGRELFDEEQNKRRDHAFHLENKGWIEDLRGVLKGRGRERAGSQREGRLEAMDQRLFGGGEYV